MSDESLNTDASDDSRPSGRKRTAARLAAVQALYGMELSGCHANEAIDVFSVRGQTAVLDGETLSADPRYFADIVRGVTAREEDIDATIQSVLSGDRTVERLESIMRAILRSAVWELIARGDVDARVIISEYLSIAASFFDGSEPGFVNGVLDRIAHIVREDEFDDGKS